MANPQTILTIEQLAACVAQALSGELLAEMNGRIRQIPDVRTLRYYTTLGLLDRPAAMRGRTALYRRRHVLQLVAIKRLQAKGMSLAEIQARLLGAADGALAKMARLPSGFTVQPSVSASERSSHDATTSLDPASSSFWKARPALSAASPGEVSSATPAELAASQPPAHEPPPASVSDASTPVPLLVGVPLAHDVSLLLPAHRELDEVDRDAIHAAAQPLLKLLLQRRILPRKD